MAGQTTMATGSSKKAPQEPINRSKWLRSYMQKHGTEVSFQDINAALASQGIPAVSQSLINQARKKVVFEKEFAAKTPPAKPTVAAKPVAPPTPVPSIIETSAVPLLPKVEEAPMPAQAAAVVEKTQAPNPEMKEAITIPVLIREEDVREVDEAEMLLQVEKQLDGLINDTDALRSTDISDLLRKVRRRVGSKIEQLS